MTGVSGAGRWPGVDVLEAQTVVVGDLADAHDEVDGLPFAVELPERGTHAAGVGRAAARLVEMPTEIGPHGWKLADRPGADLARAQALAREDLDALAVAAHGYAGPLVVPALGPLTLAARLYLARGDRVLTDPGAVRDLADSAGAGLAEHVAAVRRTVPGAEVTVLLHEPLLAQVVAGVLPTFSGFAMSGGGAMRPVRGPVAAERLGGVLDPVRAAGAVRVVVHGGASWTALRVVREARADAAALEVGGLDERAWEHVAETVEAGLGLWAQVPPPATSQCAGDDVVGQADALTRPWRSVGLPVAGLGDVVVLAPRVPDGTSPDDARGALAGTVRCARIVAERAQR
ncbi:hypothetical protein [Cellulomonas sp. HZM]|uniref:hypothetical protein n=1 Tax=Cellulomonas sp. HZM TaxID=1454010 RepID=UPI0004933BF6|nr:hypothetical protein [Cellulomonas sp. HZM]